MGDQLLHTFSTPHSIVTGTLVPLGEKTVVGGLSARRYNPGKVAPGGFHCRTRVSLVTSLPFAIAQHPHPRESERWLLPLPPSPAGRAGWGIRADCPMKPSALRPGSGQRQGGRARTHKHTHTHTRIRGRAHSHLHTHTQHCTGREKRGGSFSRWASKPTRPRAARRAFSFSHSPLITFPSSSPPTQIRVIQELVTFSWGGGSREKAVEESGILLSSFKSDLHYLVCVINQLEGLNFCLQTLRTETDISF